MGLGKGVFKINFGAKIHSSRYIVMNYAVSNFPGPRATLKFLSSYNDHELMTLSANQMLDLF